jgi:hypothetical protein
MLKGVKTIAAGTGKDDGLQEIINNYWSPSLTVIGMEGLPPLDKAGNVIYSKFSVRCSMRLPPTLPHQQAVDTLTSLVL